MKLLTYPSGGSSSVAVATPVSKQITSQITSSESGPTATDGVNETESTVPSTPKENSSELTNLPSSGITSSEPASTATDSVNETESTVPSTPKENSSELTNLPSSGITSSEPASTATDSDSPKHKKSKLSHNSPLKKN